MNVDIVTRGGDIHTPLRKYVEKKVQRLARLFDGIESVRVVFAKERFSHRVEVTVVDRHGTTKGKETTEDFRSAFDLVMDKLEARGRKSKALIKEEKRREAPARDKRRLSWQVNVIDPASISEDERPRIVKKKTLPIKSMTMEEAAGNLEDSKNDFIVFRDDTSGKISVLYRRRDDTFGLIEPEV